ncbi:MAG TPA: hypothetical protein VLZ06_12755 [Solirubrobacteraceae bacterium]|nr:hypothetical protein [Solirubrobacteraceae bacterium]
MKRFHIVGLALAAVFACSAVAASAAMAERQPKFIKCVKVGKVTVKYKSGTKEKEKAITEGKYSGKSCGESELAPEKTGKYPPYEGPEGKYEAEELGEEGHGLTFTAKSKTTTITAQGVNGKPQVVTCKKDAFEGELSNTYVGDHEAGSGKIFPAKLTLSDCTGNSEKSDVCGTAGTITYKPQYMEAFWLAEGEAKPGLLNVGAPSFECNGEAVTLEGLLIGTVENTTKGVNIVWNVTGGGAQEDQTFFSEGFEETGYHLESTPSGSEATVAGKEEIKLKGVSER